MGLLDMLLDNSDKLTSVAAQVGLPESQTKAALDKIVPMVRDRFGTSKKPTESDDHQTAEQVAAETGVPVADVKKLMALTLAEAYKDPRFVGMDMADGVMDGKIGKPIKK